MSEEELERNSRELTFLADVREWVETHDCLEGRFRFYNVYKPNSIFYQRVARPLMLMRTTGSIDVERVAKPFKHSILTKERNRLSDEKGNVLLRLGKNLQLLMQAKIAVKGTVFDVLAKHGPSGRRTD